MGLFGTEEERINKKILKIEHKRARVVADPLHSKDDLIAFDLELEELQNKLKQIKR